MLYQVVHLTQYLYGASVSQCQSEVRLTPRALPWQAVLESSIKIDPEPAAIRHRTDYFGNPVSAFAILRSHDRFSTIATSLVRVESTQAALSTAVTWEAARDHLAQHPTLEAIEALEFVLDSPLVTVGPEIAAYAAPSFTPGRPLLEAVGELSRRIHDDFAYKPSATSVDTTLLEALRRRRGVCQDFTHVMIGALRSVGLAARYVSGYLRSGTDYQGAEASHAWVSVYFPESGWVAFDPTNAVIPDTGHVTVAWGRDYGDVTPVKGVTLGGGDQVIKVDVRVEPAEGLRTPQSD
jgi:transglutaminase-like putative cysteine protease